MREDRKFLFFLAEELGMTVRQLMNNIDAREIMEWSAYFKIKTEKPKETPDQIAEKMRQTFSMPRFKGKKRR